MRPFKGGQFRNLIRNSISPTKASRKPFDSQEPKGSHKLKPAHDPNAKSIFDATDHQDQDIFSGALLLTIVSIVTVLAFFVLKTVKSQNELAAEIFIDDSFMYLETAWQTAISGFVTFDSMNPTNGVQFLWFVIIFIAAVFSPTKIAFLYVVYCIMLALVGSIYFAIWRIGTLLSDRRRVLTMLMAVMWTIVVADRKNLIFSGMESTLHMATLWLCLLAGLTTLVRSNVNKRFPEMWFFLFTAGTVAVTWSRVDSMFFSLALYIYVVLNLYGFSGGVRNGGRRIISLSVCMVVICGLVQVGFFYFAGETIVPISALVKATGIGPEISANLLGRIISVVFPFAKLFDEENFTILLLQAVVFFVLFGLITIRAIRCSPPLRYLYGFAGSLGVAIPIYAVLVGPSHHPEWRWYLSAVFLFYIIGVAALLYEAFGDIAEKLLTKRSVAVLIGIPIALMFLFMMFYSYRTIPHFLARVQVAQFLKKMAGEKDILAAFNAGELAFFSDRRTVNLDGLVNSKNYFENIFNKPDHLMEYLKKNGVRYIVDYDFYWARDVILKNTVQVYAFEMPNDRTRKKIVIRELTHR